MFANCRLCATRGSSPKHRVFSCHETLCSESKYYCEECCSKQEATKRLRVKKLPQILALHLKRFKYVEQHNRFTKLTYRVVFPWELKLFNTVRVIQVRCMARSLILHMLYSFSLTMLRTLTGCMT